MRHYQLCDLVSVLPCVLIQLHVFISSLLLKACKWSEHSVSTLVSEIQLIIRIHSLLLGILITQDFVSTTDQYTLYHTLKSRLLIYTDWCDENIHLHIHS